MTPREFFRRFLFHVALASTIWFAFAVAIEKLIPGFVAPFIDLAWAGLVVGALLIVTILTQTQTSRTGRIAGIVVVTLAIVSGGLFAWSRLNSLGTSGVVLLGAAGVMGALTIVALAVASG